MKKLVVFAILIFKTLLIGASDIDIELKVRCIRKKNNKIYFLSNSDTLVAICNNHNYKIPPKNCFELNTKYILDLSTNEYSCCELNFKGVHYYIRSMAAELFIRKITM